MTLTPEQIEVQRKKFESVHPVPNGMFWCADKKMHVALRRPHQIVKRNYNILFDGWISCVESNEIEMSAYAKRLEDENEKLIAELKHYQREELDRVIKRGENA